MSCGTTGEELPTLHDDIDINGVKLQTIADAAGHFGRYQSRARAEKRVVHRLAGPAVIDDRAAHAFYRLLRAVARPVAAFASAHRVPGSLMLPVVIAAAQYKMLFEPNDLRAKLKLAGD